MASRKEALQYYKQGDYRKALKIAKNFTINVTEAERRLMTMGYECYVNPVFYRQLGYDVEYAKETAIEVLKKVLNFCNRD